MTKPILCLDFDGVLHEYTSGWEGARTISDMPVNGAMEFLLDRPIRYTHQRNGFLMPPVGHKNCCRRRSYIERSDAQKLLFPPAWRPVPEQDDWPRPDKQERNE